MECACLVNASIDDGTWEDNCITKYVVSKTTHVCVECERKIPPGERYLLEIVSWEGDHDLIERYKTCRDCESLRNNLCCDWIYGSIWEDIEYALEEIEDDMYPWSTFAKLTPRARNFIFNIIEKWWDNDNK